MHFFPLKTLIQDHLERKKGCTSPSPWSLALPGLHLEGEELVEANKESSVGQRSPQKLLPALRGIKQKRKWSSTQQGQSLSGLLC